MSVVALLGMLYGAGLTSCVWLACTRSSTPTHPWGLLWLPIAFLLVGVAALVIRVLVLAVDNELGDA